MKSLFLLFVLLALIITPFAVIAQEPEAGSGGLVIEGNFSGSVNIGSFNPLRCGGVDCQRIWGFMFPTVIGASPYTQQVARVGEEGVTNALATDWTISDDGTTYTFTLREDAMWSDGTPITARDVKFAFDAIKSGQIENSALTGVVDYSEGNPTGIVEVNVINDYTVEMVYGAASCDALLKAGYPLVPPQAFGYDDSADFDFSVMNNHEFDTNPSVVYGPFEFAGMAAGESIGLRNLASYPDADVIVPEGFVYRDVPDQTVMVEQFLAGETNFIDTPPVSRMEDLRTSPDVNAFNFPGNAWDFVGLNLADPLDPQPAYDENGAAIDQGHHPLFGDVRVRRALQMALNIPEIIEGAVFGEAMQMPSAEVPTSWAYADIEPVAFDQEGAAAMLAEAGWVKNDEGTLVCQGCMYAEEGTPFDFELITNQGNARREAIGVIIQDQLGELGITVDFQAIDFNTLINQVYGSQEFDAYIGGWRNGFPANPNQLASIFTPVSDDPFIQGSNAVSYNNPELTDLLTQANTVPGCDPMVQTPMYQEAQRILHEDQPYLFLYVINGMYGTQSAVQGFSPEPNVAFNNIERWLVKTN